MLRELDAGGFALETEESTTDLALQPPQRESWSSRAAWVALMLFGIPLPWRRRNSDDVVREA